MKPASAYDITFPYGATNPIGGGKFRFYGPRSKTLQYIADYHGGDDRAMRGGTPVDVNGQVIGLSGNTGAVGGSGGGFHLHISKLVNGRQTNPRGQGFTLDIPVVRYTGYDSGNGNHVILRDAHGVDWYYDHLSKINVKVGQTIGVIMDNVTIVGKPKILTTQAGKRIDIFVKGSDNGLWQQFFNEKGWQKNWVRVGGGVVELDKVVVDGNRYDVYCRGVATDVMHFYLTDKWNLESLGIPKGKV